MVIVVFDLVSLTIYDCGEVSKVGVKGISTGINGCDLNYASRRQKSQRNFRLVSCVFGPIPGLVGSRKPAEVRRPLETNGSDIVIQSLTEVRI